MGGQSVLVCACAVFLPFLGVRFPEPSLHSQRILSMPLVLPKSRG